MNLERNPTTVITYPRWLRGWCALTVGVSFAAIVVGTLVTTFDVGMADKVWPTPPWYLFVTEQIPSFGWYIEHLHRIVAFSVGAVVFVQSLAVWSFCPNKTRRWVALGSLLVLAAGLGTWMRQAHGVER